MFFSLNTCDVESPKVCFLMFPCRSRCGDRDEPSPKRIKTEVRETSLQPDYSQSFFQGHVERNRFWSPQTQLETLTHSVLVSTNTALNFQTSRQRYLFFLPQTQLEIILSSPYKQPALVSTNTAADFLTSCQQTSFCHHKHVLTFPLRSPLNSLQSWL